MGLESSVYDTSIAVTPSDGTNDPNGPFAALWIGVGNTLTFIDTSGNTCSTTVPAGLFPVRVVRVKVTGTAATQILGLKGIP